MAGGQQPVRHRVLRRSDRPRQTRAGRDQLRELGRRQHRPSVDGTAAEGDTNLVRAHPLQGRRAGADGCAGRPGRCHRDSAERVDAVHPERQAQGAGGVQPEAQPELPQVPTFEELGYKQLTVISWVGLSAPRKTRPEVVRKVNEAVREAMTRPELQKKLDAEGITPMTMTPDEFTRVVKSDTERWGALTRSLQLKAN
ncbi:hypothetical protein CKY39_10605 [Variovorax boronicumulans]|uniref:Tripartite tricarboxylate transporter substrate binding protein n=1 Tax=Variovorax boronicumulans TaxID=436515 RepID=A0A250DGV9_9BURK|nr:hypothetical protein CKY39_10605 [Variovorax boronicumulans]